MKSADAVPPGKLARNLHITPDDDQLIASGYHVVAMENVTSLQGPVEKVDGKLVLFIPLSAGGDQFIECSRGISEVEGEYLKSVIPEWLAGTLRIEEGSVVAVDNRNGKFNIHPVNPLPIQ